MTKLRALTRRQLRAIFAIVVAVCVVVPACFGVANLFGKAEDTVSRVTVDGLETVKTVSPVAGEDGKFHVKLEAFNTAEQINQPANDIILVLDDSSRMNTVLYHRNYKNLNTHTMFTKINNASYNALHDGENPHNDGSIDIGNSYSKNKYVEDPNTPGVYVYLATDYYKDSLTGATSHHYVYTFTDSYGNVYEHTTANVGSIGSLIFSAGQEFEFHLVTENPVGDVKDTVVIKDFYQRVDGETNALTSTLLDHVSGRTAWEKQETRTTPGRRYQSFGNYRETTLTEDIYTAHYNYTKLFILSDTGERLPVKLDVERIVFQETFNNNGNEVNHGQYISKYIFTAEDPETGKVYRAVQGNDSFGADYGVFQGFKTYHYKTDPTTGEYILDNNGKKILEVEHDSSIESKSLYTTKEGQDVTRLDATKEAVENFAIKVHQDAYYKGTDVRLGIVTYGKNGTVFEPLTSVYDEVGVNYLIDRVYHIETEKTNLGISDSPAAQIDKGMQTAYNHFATNSPADNKRFAVAFTAGMPTKNYFGSNSRENDYNTDVATGAIQYAYKMKNEQAVNMYSVGMYEYARQNQTHGDWFHYTLWPSYPCSGKVGSIWGASRGAEILNGDEIDATDAAAVNRMMNYISSNYMDAQQIGLYRRTLGLNPAGHIIATSVLTGKGYQVTKNYNQIDDGHNFAVSTRNENGDPVSGEQINADLQAVFDQLANEMQVAHGFLSGETQLVDNITDYFDLIPESVTAKTVNYQGPSLSSNNCWTEDDVPVDPATLYPNEEGFEAEEINLVINNGEPLTKDTKELSLTGFPYSENYVVEDKHVTNKAGNYGKKVVLEFDIQRNEDLIGGNHVPTNVSNSGIYDVDSNLEEHFEVPYVDLAIIADNVKTTNESIYYSYEADLAGLLDPNVVNGFNNQFVDITYTVTDPESPSQSITFTIPAGETAPSESATLARYPQLTASKKYNVTVTVDPTIRPGTVGQETLDPQEANVYVFVPALDVLDETVEPGSTVDLTPTVHDPAAICDLNMDADETNDVEAPLPTTDPPEIAYQIINKTDNNAVVPQADWEAYQIDETQDFQVVNVTVPARTFTYYEARQVQATDDNGQGITDDQGNPVMVTEMVAVDTNRSAVSIPQNKVLFTNTTAPSKTDGSFTKFTGTPFDFFINKKFDGDYANPEAVTFTITGSDGSTQTVTINRNDFTGLQSSNKQAATQLKTGITYTVTEGFVNTETDEAKYDTTFSGKWMDAQDAETAVTDTDGDTTNEVFVFTIPSSDQPEAMYLAVTNTDTTEYPPLTGRTDEAETPLGLIVAAACATAAAGFGAYKFYLVKKAETNS